MIKLIKDLTDNEIDKICKSQKYCSDCPLYLGMDSDHQEICLQFNYDAFEKALEISNKEINTDEATNGQNIEKMDDKE